MLPPIHVLALVSFCNASRGGQGKHSAICNRNCRTTCVTTLPPLPLSKWTAKRKPSRVSPWINTLCPRLPLPLSGVTRPNTALAASAAWRGTAGASWRKPPATVPPPAALPQGRGSAASMRHSPASQAKGDQSWGILCDDSPPSRAYTSMAAERCSASSAARSCSSWRSASCRCWCCCDCCAPASRLLAPPPAAPPPPPAEAYPHCSLLGLQVRGGWAGWVGREGRAGRYRCQCRCRASMGRDEHAVTAPEQAEAAAAWRRPQEGVPGKKQGIVGRGGAHVEESVGVPEARGGAAEGEAVRQRQAQRAPQGIKQQRQVAQGGAQRASLCRHLAQGGGSPPAVGQRQGAHHRGGALRGCLGWGWGAR